jgi:hypothetical protein
MMNNETGRDPLEAKSASDTEVALMEQDVAHASRAFSASLNDASQAGVQTVTRAVARVRPVLICITLLGGAILTIKLLRRDRRSISLRLPKDPARGRPLWAELARSAAITLASVAARRLAARWF